jgi:hypothetical protein
MQCSTCGHQNRPGARFCEECAAPLSRGGQTGNMPPPSQFNTPHTGPGGQGWQSPTTINQALSKSKSSRSAGSSPIPTTPSLQRGRHGGVVGVARNIQLRSQQSGFANFQRTTQILSFRLEQYDRIGNRVRVAPVEMRGQNIIGFITDGDWVEVFGKEKDGLLDADATENLSQGALVEARRYPHPLLIPLVAILVVVLFFCILSTSNSNSFSPNSSSGSQTFATPTLSPDDVLRTYCDDLKSRDFHGAYYVYSTGLKSKVTEAQLRQMWSEKSMMELNSCTYDPVQVSGTRATTTISIRELFWTSQERYYTYHVVLVQDGSNGWKIDSIEPQ